MSHSGMTTYDDAQQPQSRQTRRKPQNVKVIRKKSERRKYVSKHFGQNKSTTKKLPPKRRKLDRDENTGRRVLVDNDELNEIKEENTYDTSAITQADFSGAKHESSAHVSQPVARVFYGVNIDELSSDSDLTDVPDDIGPDPFTSTTVVAVKSKRKKPKLKARKHGTTSPYFPDLPARHKPRPNFLVTLPFPPLSAPTFGLMQEKLAHNPFRLLLATIFLNKTPGMRAMPIFYRLMDRYPTPKALAAAKQEDVRDMIHQLGFQNQRARKCIEMAKKWVECPPVKGRRYRKLHYPQKGDGRDVKEGEVVEGYGEDDTRVAWEISHLPGLGPYSHDSWRMFCRDELRGLATDWLGGGAVEEGFEPEWKRVLPTDKELRAWLTWMWLKDGWMWNKETGKRTKADEELLTMAREGGVVQEAQEKDHLQVRQLDSESGFDYVSVEKPAGDFM